MSPDLLDPHGVLEIHVDADETVIRRAYRKQAMRWHPDRNAHPQAAERFKQIRAAYEFLLAAGRTDDADEDAEAAEEGAAPRGEDRHEEIWLTLEEAMLGCDKPFRIVRESECEDCAGSGNVELAHTRMCSRCHGSGRVRTADGLQTCRACEGKGFSTRVDCETCGGSGRRQAEQAITVHVASGVRPGEVLRLKGLGHAHADGGEPGLLFLTLRLQPHPIFRLEGRNLHAKQPISVLRLLAGGRLSVAGPLGPIVVDLEPGVPGQRELRLAGHGFPARGGALDGAGELVVELTPALPQALSKAQLGRLAALEAELHADAARHYPEVDAWWQAYRATRS